jgi:hypothetical protein
MKASTIAMMMALCLAAAAVCFAVDASTANMGTWKLNQTKSQLAPGATRNHTVIYKAAGESVKVTVKGTTSDGKSVQSEWTGKFDGKFYPVTGDPSTDERSYKKIDDRTLELTTRKDGKVVATGRIVVSADGKSRTVTTTPADAKNATARSVAMYDKQ